MQWCEGIAIMLYQPHAVVTKLPKCQKLGDICVWIYICMTQVQNYNIEWFLYPINAVW